MKRRSVHADHTDRSGAAMWAPSSVVTSVGCAKMPANSGTRCIWYTNMGDQVRVRSAVGLTWARLCVIVSNLAGLSNWGITRREGMLDEPSVT